MLDNTLLISLNALSSCSNATGHSRPWNWQASPTLSNHVFLRYFTELRFQYSSSSLQCSCHLLHYSYFLKQQFNESALLLLLDACTLTLIRIFHCFTLRCPLNWWRQNISLNWRKKPEPLEFTNKCVNIEVISYLFEIVQLSTVCLWSLFTSRTEFSYFINVNRPIKNFRSSCFLAKSFQVFHYKTCYHCNMRKTYSLYLPLSILCKLSSSKIPSDLLIYHSQCNKNKVKLLDVLISLHLHGIVQLEEPKSTSRWAIDHVPQLFHARAWSCQLVYPIRRAHLPREDFWAKILRGSRLTFWYFKRKHLILKVITSLKRGLLGCSTVGEGIWSCWGSLAAFLVYVHYKCLSFGI